MSIFSLRTALFCLAFGVPNNNNIPEKCIFFCPQIFPFQSVLALFVWVHKNMKSQTTKIFRKKYFWTKSAVLKFVDILKIPSSELSTRNNRLTLETDINSQDSHGSTTQESNGFKKSQDQNLDAEQNLSENNYGIRKLFAPLSSSGPQKSTDGTFQMTTIIIATVTKNKDKLITNKENEHQATQSTVLGNHLAHFIQTSFTFSSGKSSKLKVLSEMSVLVSKGQEYINTWESQKFDEGINQKILFRGNIHDTTTEKQEILQSNCTTFMMGKMMTEQGNIDNNKQANADLLGIGYNGQLRLYKVMKRDENCLRETKKLEILSGLVLEIASSTQMKPTTRDVTYESPPHPRARMSAAPRGRGGQGH
jgi:hypothetical protein